MSHWHRTQLSHVTTLLPAVNNFTLYISVNENVSYFWIASGAGCIAETSTLIDSNISQPPVQLLIRLCPAQLHQL